MKCLTKLQLSNYINEEKTEDFESHLADCEDCRKQLLVISSQSICLSPGLEKKTIKGVQYAVKMEHKSSRNSQVTGHFNQSIKFALAAGFLVVITYGMIMNKSAVYNFFKNAVKIVRMDSVNALQGRQEMPLIRRNFVSLKQIDSTKQTASVNCNSLKNHKGNALSAVEKESIIRLGKSSGILTEPKTRLTIKVQTDTNACVEMLRGNALFSIESNRYRSFIVKTPTAVITVTGTVFSIFVDKKYTMVNVAQGAVRLNRPNKSQVAVVEQGNGAVADKDSIINLMLENSPIFKEREHLLQEYIQQTILGKTDSDTTGNRAFGEEPKKTE